MELLSIRPTQIFFGPPSIPNLAYNSKIMVSSYKERYQGLKIGSLDGPTMDLKDQD